MSKIEDNSADTETVIQDELVPLYRGQLNPNHDIFVTPTQDGADKDDQWNGSIGDAVMEHVSAMRHKLLEMENFVHMPNGNIFRIEHNVAPPDETGQRAINAEINRLDSIPDIRAHDLSKMRVVDGKRWWPAADSVYADGRRAPIRRTSFEDKKAVLAFYREELELVSAERAEREDIMEQHRVPFDQWEAMPGQMGIDIPSTPAQLYIYAGNSTQMFYDYVPEDHPDLSQINAFLSMTNGIDGDNFDEGTVEYFKNWLFGQEWEHKLVPERLYQLCQDIYESTKDDPADLAEVALQEIDQDWGEILRPSVITNFYANDPVFAEIRALEEKLSANKKTGALSWAEVGKFGQTLYKKYGREVKTAHWHLYHNLKARFSPEILVNSVDLNHASMFQLRHAFGKRFKKEVDQVILGDLSDEQATLELKKIDQKVESICQWIHFNRPFKNLESLAEKGVISVNEITSTTNTAAFIATIKKAYRDGLNLRSGGPLGKVAQQIINLQKTHPDACTEEEWYSVWQTYRICKTQVTNAISK